MPDLKDLIVPYHESIYEANRTFLVRVFDTLAQLGCGPCNRTESYRGPSYFQEIREGLVRVLQPNWVWCNVNYKGRLITVGFTGEGKFIVLKFRLRNTAIPTPDWVMRKKQTIRSKSIVKAFKRLDKVIDGVELDQNM